MKLITILKSSTTGEVICTLPFLYEVKKGYDINFDYFDKVRVQILGRVVDIEPDTIILHPIQTLERRISIFSNHL